MGWLEQTEHILRRALFEACAIEAQPPILKPQVDLSIADLSSSMCLRAARLLNQTPDSVAQRVAEIAAPQIVGDLSVERGFINIRGPRALAWLNKIEHSVSPSEQSLAIIVARSTEVATVRMLARACMQTRLCRSDTRIFLYSAQGIEALQLGAMKWSDNWWELCQVALQRQPISATTSGLCGNDWEGQLSAIKAATLWVEPNCVRYACVKSTVSQMRSRGIELNLAVPSKRWGANARHDVLTLLGSNDRGFNLARLVYLASNLIGSELDATVPTLEERANPVSMLRLTSSRISELSRSVTNISGQQPISSELVARILLRCRFLPIFVANAARFAEIGELISVLDDLSRTFQRYFNQPEIRRKLSLISPDNELETVISGVQDALAYILTVLEDDPVGEYAQAAP